MIGLHDEILRGADQAPLPRLAIGGSGFDNVLTFLVVLVGTVPLWCLRLAGTVVNTRCSRDHIRCFVWRNKVWEDLGIAIATIACLASPALRENRGTERVSAANTLGVVEGRMRQWT